LASDAAGVAWMKAIGDAKAAKAAAKLGPQGPEVAISGVHAGPGVSLIAFVWRDNRQRLGTEEDECGMWSSRRLNSERPVGFGTVQERWWFARGREKAKCSELRRGRRPTGKVGPTESGTGVALTVAEQHRDLHSAIMV
jgi:hypothetical protein